MKSKVILADVLLCPNLDGFELAPATAKRGKEKKVRAAASVDMIIDGCDTQLSSFSAINWMGDYGAIIVSSGEVWLVLTR